MKRSWVLPKRQGFIRLARIFGCTKTATSKERLRFVDVIFWTLDLNTSLLAAHDCAQIAMNKKSQHSPCRRLSVLTPTSMNPLERHLSKRRWCTSEWNNYCPKKFPCNYLTYYLLKINHMIFWTPNREASSSQLIHLLMNARRLSLKPINIFRCFNFFHS